jgi:hypothetical protein
MEVDIDEQVLRILNDATKMPQSQQPGIPSTLVGVYSVLFYNWLFNCGVEYQIGVITNDESFIV